MTTLAPPRLPQHDIPALKDRLLIPQVWQALGLPGQPGARCRSPFRPDKTPSFSLYDSGRRWKDFATNEGGDVIDFIAAARQTNTAQALRLFLELAGVPVPLPQHALPPPSPQATSPRSRAFQAPAPTSQPPQPQPQPQIPAPGTVRVTLQRGTPADWQQVAQTRRISQEAVSLALALRTLTFGTVQNVPCWILTDAENRIAEARRLDGVTFPEAGPLAERKAHTLRGSRKSWPLGAGVLRRIPDFRTLLLVEGGPDYLAALHFAHEMERWDVLPVAMLGRGTGTHIDPAALELMRGRRVRIYPHADADGGGVRSAGEWAYQLEQAGCRADYFDFSPLRRTDGRPVNDLNDCTEHLDAESTLYLRKSLLPAPDLEVDLPADLPPATEPSTAEPPPF